MKRTLIRVGIGAALLIIGFVGGRIFQNLKNGYSYKVLEQKEYASSLGPIEWNCVSETVGLPVLDPEKTTISFENRIIYKAQRDFQESSPFAENIETASNSIVWDDRDFRYHLTVEPFKKPEPNGNLHVNL